MRLTNNNELGCLEQSFVIPLWMLFLQDATHSVVFPQPDGLVQEQSWHEAKEPVAHGKLPVLRDVEFWRVVHFHRGIFEVRRVVFAINHLEYMLNVQDFPYCDITSPV